MLAAIYRVMSSVGSLGSLGERYESLSPSIPDSIIDQRINDQKSESK
jgi:hypothetical protein